MSFSGLEATEGGWPGVPVPSAGRAGAVAGAAVSAPAAACYCSIPHEPVPTAGFLFVRLFFFFYFCESVLNQLLAFEVAGMESSNNNEVSENTKVLGKQRSAVCLILVRTLPQAEIRPVSF